jgi:hypothetical protein
MFTCLKKSFVLFCFLTKLAYNQAWWYRPVIIALERTGQENHKFQASQGYIIEALSQKKIMYVILISKSLNRKISKPIYDSFSVCQSCRALFKYS